MRPPKASCHRYPCLCLCGPSFAAFTGQPLWAPWGRAPTSASNVARAAMERFHRSHFSSGNVDSNRNERTPPTDGVPGGLAGVAISRADAQETPEGARDPRPGGAPTASATAPWPHPPDPVSLPPLCPPFSRTPLRPTLVHPLPLRGLPKVLPHHPWHQIARGPLHREASDIHAYAPAVTQLGGKIPPAL